VSTAEQVSRVSFRKHPLHVYELCNVESQNMNSDSASDSDSVGGCTDRSLFWLRLEALRIRTSSLPTHHGTCQEVAGHQKRHSPMSQLLEGFRRQTGTSSQLKTANTPSMIAPIPNTSARHGFASKRRRNTRLLWAWAVRLYRPPLVQRSADSMWPKLRTRTLQEMKSIKNAKTRWVVAAVIGPEAEKWWLTRFSDLLTHLCRSCFVLV